MSFGTWNVRRLYRGGSPTTAGRELDLVGKQEVRWSRAGTVRAGFIFFLWRRKRKPSIVTGYFVHHRIMSAVKKVDFVSDTMSFSSERLLV
jgi:hypothetical protein